jgi:DMSO/TMAO reductase YedYZ heme-binding membrane subunit
MIEKKGYMLIGAVLGTMILDLVLISFIDASNPFDVIMRLCGLYGYFGISISTIMTPFLKEIKHTFGRSFIEVHHVTAVIGIACITAHPVIYALEIADATVFIPVVSSWMDFWTWAGPPALILMYIAFVVILLRQKLAKYWRSLHALMYVVLLFGIIHANLIQSDFADITFGPVLVILYDVLFGIVTFAFFLKRWQRYTLNHQKSKTNHEQVT